MIRPLAPPHSFQIQAASGWLELGNVAEAWNELQQRLRTAAGRD